MKTFAPGIGVSIALLLTGCTSTVMHQIHVTTEPVDAHVTLSARWAGSAPPLAEADTFQRRATFTVTGSRIETLELRATAPGFESSEPLRITTEGDQSVTLVLEENSERRDARLAAETTARRRDFVAAHPELSDAQKSAVLAGELLAGMDGATVNASIGDLIATTESGGLGGNWTCYRSNDHGQVTYLYFHDGWLVRWSRMASSGLFR